MRVLEVPVRTRLPCLVIRDLGKKKKQTWVEGLPQKARFPHVRHWEEFVYGEVQGLPWWRSG